MTETGIENFQFHESFEKVNKLSCTGGKYLLVSRGKLLFFSGWQSQNNILSTRNGCVCETYQVVKKRRFTFEKSFPFLPRIKQVEKEIFPYISTGVILGLTKVLFGLLYRHP